MVERLSDGARLACVAAAGLVLLAGATLDLVYGFLLQRRGWRGLLARADELRGRPFAPRHAAAVLLLTLLFAWPALDPPAGAPAGHALLLAPVLYACAGLLATGCCLYQAQATFGGAFGSARCGPWRAARHGLGLGLAAVPPVLLLSHLVSAAAAARGYAPPVQDVFGWLTDPAVPLTARVFLMVSAVTIAPAVEEALFRGVLFPVLARGRSPVSAMLLSGLYFALVHVHGPSLLPLLALSFAFSLAYLATGSLLTPIVMHAVFNAASLLLFYAAAPA